MPKAKPARLDSSIVLPVKGQAKASVPKEPTGNLISLTVRVDQERYVWLKTHGARERLSTQEIMIKALDEYRKAADAQT